MDGQAIARWATASEWRIDMADARKCIGSAKFGIEAHEALVADFPVQPSQRDGLGRMCKPHWKAYVGALRKAALVRKTADAIMATHASVAEKPVTSAATFTPVPKPAKHTSARGGKKPEPIRTRPARGRKTEGAPIVEANAEEASIA
jgi:hypothetical protein